MAFGHGAHYCAGAQLAVTQTLVLLPAVFDRFPGMTLVVDPATIGSTPGFIGDGPATLPVRLGLRNPIKGGAAG
jgi:cytochrome P450